MKIEDADSIKRELLARIEPIVDDIARELSRRLVDDKIFMTRTEYAKRREVGVKKISEWVRAGLPHRGSGKNLRIKVAEADAWDDGEATRRNAQLDAHGAKR